MQVEIGVTGNARGAEQENVTEITSRRTRGREEYGSREGGRHSNESTVWTRREREICAVEIVDHCRYTAILRGST